MKTGSKISTDRQLKTTIQGLINWMVRCGAIEDSPEHEVKLKDSYEKLIVAGK